MPETELSEATLALAAMICCLQEFDSKILTNALVTAIVAQRTRNDRHGIIRLEHARDAVAIMSATLATEVMKLDTAINSIKEGEPCSTMTPSED